MTIHIRCSGSAGSPGIQRGDRPVRDHGAAGFDLVPLTLGKTTHIVGRRGSKQTVRGESARTARLAPRRASLRAVSPACIGGRSIMPRNCGILRLFACDLTKGNLRGRLGAASAMLALALGASFVSAPVRAQEGQIVNPGSMAVTGFSGTIIPGIEEGLPPGSTRSTKPSSTRNARPCAFSTFLPLAVRRPASSSIRRSPSRCSPARSARSSLWPMTTASATARRPAYQISTRARHRCTASASSRLTPTMTAGRSVSAAARPAPPSWPASSPRRMAARPARSGRSMA